MVFSIWDENNICLPYELTRDFCNKNGFHHVPVISHSIWSGEDYLSKAFMEGYSKHEGYVIRLSKEFEYENFDRSVAKYVRENHVQTDKHWMHQKVIPNRLNK
jgi:hypothetical protein